MISRNALATVGVKVPTVAVDLGRTNVRIAAWRGAGTTPSVESIAFSDLLSASSRPAIGALVARIRSVARGAGLPAELALGFAVASSVSSHDELLEDMGNGVPSGGALRDALRDEFGERVLIENDATCAAYGEGRHGAGRGDLLSDYVLLTLGTNVGLGVIIGGEPYRGAHGMSGEIGWLPYAAHAGDPARAEYRSLESVVGGRALAEELERRGAPAEARLFPVDPSDPIAAPIGRMAIAGWAMALAAVAVILDPSHVFVGGGLGRHVASDLGAVRDTVARLVPVVPEMRVAELGDDAGLAGAAALVQRRWA